jgi:hypothetical protein
MVRQTNKKTSIVTAKKKAKGEKSNNHNKPKIHPLIMYPFSQPKSLVDLKCLYGGLVKKLSQNTDKYCKPITVLNRQTFYNNTLWKYNPRNKNTFKDFFTKYVKQYSDVINAWSVDTCQMWLSGFGKAFDSRSTDSDVYWIIPGDFNYSEVTGVLDEMLKLPDIVANHDQDICLGEIKVKIDSSKQLIDTYGTYGLLYNWFPAEAQGIRKKTDKPRTEFFAINHSTLSHILSRRWYAYEQMIVILLQAVAGGRRINTVSLGKLSDLPQGRETLSAAMQQVERTERVLKLHWREVNEAKDRLWPDTFRKLDNQSEQIRGAALVILEQILRVY